MIYDPDQDSVHILNPAAQMIYDLHRKGLAAEQIAAALRQRFQVPPEQPLEEDIRKAIEGLAHRSLL